MKYNIYTGIDGGYGGVEYQFTDEFDSEEEASVAAWHSACQDYETFGVFDYAAFEEEVPDYTEEDLEAAIMDDRESRIIYFVIPETSEDFIND